MRFFSQLQTGLLLAGVAQTVLGQSASQSDVDATTNATAVEAAKEAAKAAAALLASMPDCGRTCLVSGIAASPCDLTDIACSCGNATITQQVELCVTERCMVKEQLSSKNATSTLCSLPVRDETHIVSWAGVIGGILAVIAYAMRMISRLPRFGGTLGWDDLAITLAIVEIIPLTVFSVLLANLGLGKDIWTVPFDNITMILKIYYFDEDLYLTALPLVKISILLFYLRIFPQDWFRYSCFAAMAACAGYGIAFLLVSVFQCIPINYAWLNWDGEHTGTCNDINAQGWTSAAFNVILDVVVLALPMPVITKLELNKRKKFFILLMFSVGFVVTVVSILRLQVLVQFGGTTNFTWHYRSVGYWSTSEINLAVICACMPGVRAMIAWVLPRVMGDTTAAKSTAKSGFGSSYDASASGPSIVKRSRPSRDLFDKSDKDFIPLVEVTDTNGSKGPSKSKDRWSMEA